MLGRAAREAVKGLGLELFGPEDENANVVTAVARARGHRRRRDPEDDARHVTASRSPAARAT